MSNKWANLHIQKFSRLEYSLKFLPIFVYMDSFKTFESTYYKKIYCGIVSILLDNSVLREIL